jgi:hypothetical protein
MNARDVAIWPIATLTALRKNVGCWGKNGSHVANRRAPVVCARSALSVPSNVSWRSRIRTKSGARHAKSIAKRLRSASEQ